METKHKYGDVHPTTNKIYWGKYRDGKEQWLTPEKFAHAAERTRIWHKTDKAVKHRREKYLENVAKREADKKERPLWLLLRGVKCSAKRTGKVYSLNEDYVQALWASQGGKCYYTNILMSLTSGLSTPRQVSIDRIDSTKGYLQGNIVLCCQSINFAKHDYSEKDFKDFINEVRSVL